MDERDDYDDRFRSSWRPTLAERSPAPDAPDARPRPRTPVATYLWSTLAGVCMVCGFLLNELGRDEKWAWPWRALVWIAMWLACSACMSIGWRHWQKINRLAPSQ